MRESEEDHRARLATAVADTFSMKDGETIGQYSDRLFAEADPGRIAAVAVILQKVAGEILAVHRTRKNEWVAEARLGFNPGRRTDCHVCGKWRDIAHAHHVVPLAAQYDRGFGVPDHQHVWLCPNHHAVLHLMIPPDRETDPMKIGRRTAGPILEMSHEELERMLELLKQSGRDVS